MYFTPIVAATVLAFTSSAAPTVAVESSSTLHSNSTSSYPGYITSSSSSYPSNYNTSSASRGYKTKTYSAAPSATGGVLSGLTKTQQILLSETRADAINNVLTENSDFVFKFLDNQKFGPSKGGEIIAANRKTFPALTGTGIGAALGKLGACGFNTPHVHPRATELLFQIEGRIVSSMFPENLVNLTDGTPREILNYIDPFESTVYFQGSVHSQFNPDCSNATFFAAQSAEDFGTGQVAQELFGFSNKEAIASVFGNEVDGADIEKFKGKISTNVALGVEECLKKCNIPKRK